MMSFLKKNHRLVFYSSWLLLGLMQSGLTELQDDEAYYWVYSKFLAWGYFDHPPMTAVLIKAGYSIFPNELGVRLFPLLLSLLSLLIIEKLTERKNPFLFYAITLSVAALQLAGFTAVPDIPLIFFTALFFWMYKKFYQQPSVANTILLGIAVALLLYSKYHAVLIVVFVLLSNLRLFKLYQVYLAGLVALLLFMPHLWWQYQHNWISFRYHLFESNVNPYRVSFTFQYLLGQVLLAGPIAGIVLLPAAFLYKPADAVEKALKYTILGIYVFFLLSSFRGKVEGNWTSPALVPLIILSHQFLNEKMQWQKWLLRLLPFSIMLVLLARIVMIADILPSAEIRQRYHAWKEWPKTMKEKTNGLPVIFNNSYQRASKYWFYSGQPAYSLNLYKGRKNNFNYWPLEDLMLGKPVFVLDKYDLSLFPDSLKTPLGYIGYRYDSSFISFAKIKIETTEKSLRYKTNEPLSLQYSFHISGNYRQFITLHENLKDTTRIGIFNSKGWVKDIYTTLSLKEAVNNPSGQLSISPGLPAGKYYLLFAISSGHYYPTHNSDKIKLTVE